MITLAQYFGSKPHTPEHEAAATELLERVEKLCMTLAWDWPIDPDTSTIISRERATRMHVAELATVDTLSSVSAFHAAAPMKG